MTTQEVRGTKDGLLRPKPKLQLWKWNVNHVQNIAIIIKRLAACWMEIIKIQAYQKMF